ncbi:GtrA family protein, partial [Streptococcus suis]|uniref:GtrA family protein n=2 Tax=Streptococcus TaxID=1301 RepID=UPI001875EE6E
YIDDNASSHFRPIKDGLLIYKNLFKFALASLGGFLVDYGAYALLIASLTALPSGIHILIANGLARLTSSLSNYYLNKKLVFQSEQSVQTTGLGYLTLALALF